MQRKEAQTLPSDKILNLLRESLLTQRWEEVLKLITVISEHRKMNYTVFKVSDVRNVSLFIYILYICVHKLTPLHTYVYAVQPLYSMVCSSMNMDITLGCLALEILNKVLALYVCPCQKLLCKQLVINHHLLSNLLHP